MSCLHARRWFYRQRLRVIGKRPVIPIVERCLNCHEVLRRDPPLEEIRQAVVTPGLLSADPWEGDDGA